MDCLGDSLVVASSAAWVEHWRPHLEACLCSLTGAELPRLRGGAEGEACGSLGITPIVARFSAWKSAVNCSARPV